jgi:hypothetical protein
MKNIKKPSAELIASQFEVAELEPRLEMTDGPYGRHEHEQPFPDVPIEEGC